MIGNAPERKTDPARERLVPTLLVLIGLALFSPNGDAAPRELNRARSIYVPVRFEACEHLANVVLTVAGDSHPFTLGTRIFMFTYYPDKKAVLPEFTEVRIQGEATTGNGVRTIRTNLLVTPERIVSSQDSLDRGEEEIVRQLRRRRDVRLPEAVIHIKCEDSCSLSTKSAARSDTATEGAPFETNR